MLASPPLAEEASGISALGVDWQSLVAYLVSFGLLLIVLYMVGYKRILGMMDQRSGRIRDSLEEADRVRRESEERQVEMQRALDEGRQESQRLLAQAREMAERYRQEEKERARQEAQAFMERAQDEIRRERDAAVEEVRRQFGELAVTAAGRVIRRSLDPQVHQDLIDEVLREGGAAKGPGR